MAKWITTPESVIEETINGLDNTLGIKTLEELEAWVTFLTIQVPFGLD